MTYALFVTFGKLVSPGRCLQETDRAEYHKQMAAVVENLH
jgi:hypothetical protein